MKEHLRRAFRAAGIDIVRTRDRIEPLGFLRHFGIRTAIDVGANAGQFAHDIRRVLPEAHIHSFEPIKECFLELVASRRGDRHFSPYNFALGDRAGMFVINKNEYSPSSSLLKNTALLEEAFPHVGQTAKDEVEARTLDSVLSAQKLEKNILLKLDVQGYEDRVLRGAERLLADVSVIIAETSFYPLYAGQILFDGIYRTLAEKGFEYHGSLQSKRHPKTGEILFEDSIFSRRGLYKTD
ncbi:MAG: hypothetical protein QOG91_159 [Candidatus Parcubacteria bacterium]|jgi:FkbM family methyltransferase|nr:hypothetical protein [Candidatus Parcubacteria bacterium]